MKNKTISRKYARLNRELHEQNEAYGAFGYQWLGQVMETARRHGCRSVLDFGAGKRTLGEFLPSPEFEYLAYDPAIPEIAAIPGVADLVVALDVMEHIEPEFLDPTLNLIMDRAQKAVLMVISTRLANKTLPDGRNTHLIVEPAEWWVARVGEWMEITMARTYPDTVVLDGVPHL